MKQLKNKIILAGAVCLLLFCAMLLYLVWHGLLAPATEGARQLDIVQPETTEAPQWTAEATIWTTEQAAQEPVEPAPIVAASGRNAQGTRQFLLTLDDFIEGFNRLYEKDLGRAWLTPAGEWSSFAQQTAPCAGTAATRYEFDPDENIHNEPGIWAYVCQDGNLCELSLGMPEHDWIEWRYEMFRSQCFYTLSFFYPELTPDEVWGLFDLLYGDASANEYISQSDHPQPKVIRWSGSAGCWAFIHDGVIRINIIPVDAQSLADFSAQGVTACPI